MILIVTANIKIIIVIIIIICFCMYLHYYQKFQIIPLFDDERRSLSFKVKITKKKSTRRRPVFFLRCLKSAKSKTTTKIIMLGTVMIFVHWCSSSPYYYNYQQNKTKRSIDYKVTMTMTTKDIDEIDK